MALQQDPGYVGVGVLSAGAGETAGSTVMAAHERPARAIGSLSLVGHATAVGLADSTGRGLGETVRNELHRDVVENTGVASATTAGEAAAPGAAAPAVRPDALSIADPATLPDPTSLADPVPRADPVQFADPATAPGPDAPGDLETAIHEALQIDSDTPDPAARIVLAPESPSGWTDSLTGTDGPSCWSRILEIERARIRRYKRPATVGFVELAGFDALAQLWGQAVAERALRLTAKTLSKELRSSDVIARVEPTRFALLLTETTEIAAINFVERARAACEKELRAASDVVGVGFGWASPPPGRDLADAVALAIVRLEAELKAL